MSATSTLEILIKLRDEASKAMSGVAGNLQKNGAAIAGVGAGMTAVGAGILLMSKNFVDAAASAEQTKIAFTTMLGSAEAASSFIKDLSKFAATTPFELKGLETASKQLLAYGFTQNEVLPNLKNLGDIASGVGMEKLPNLILAFGQVKAATHLTGMELRQFTEAGVPLLDQLSKQLGKPVAAIQAMVSEGEIGFPAVQAALASLSGEGGRFNNLMDKQSKSFSGLMSNMRDQVDLFLRQGGAPLIEILKGVALYITNLIVQVNNWATAHPQLIKVISLSVAGLGALLAVLGPLLVMLPGIAIAVEVLGAVIAALASPLGIAIAVVAALIALTGSFRTVFDEVSRVAKIIYEYLQPAITELWTNITSALWPALQQLFEALKPLAPVFDLIMKAVGALLVAGLWVLIKALTQIVQWVTVSIQVLGFLVKHITDVVSPAFTAIGNVISGLVDWFKQLYDWVSKVVDKMKAFGSSGASLNPFSSSFKIPGLASGGIVTGPTLAMIGEGNGPEAVIPLDQLGKYGGGGGGITVNITGNTISDQLDIDNLAQAVGESIMGKLQLQGRFSV